MEHRGRIIATVDAGLVRHDEGSVVVPIDTNFQVGALAAAPPRQYRL